jgi:WD40 repeat protein
MLVAGCANGRVGVFSAESGSPALSLSDSQPGFTSALSWSRDGQMLASGTQDGWVQTWDASRGVLLDKVIEHWAIQTRQPGIHHVAWHPDGKTLAVTTHNRLVMVAEMTEDGTKETKIYTKMEPTHRNHVVAWSPEGDRLAWTGGSTGVSRRDGDSLFAHGTSGLPDLLLWSPDGKLLAESGGTSAYIVVRDTQSGEVVHKIGSAKEGWRAIKSMAWSPDGSGIAVGCGQSEGNQIHVWHLESGKKLKSLVGHQGSVNAVYWLDDDRLMSLGEDDTLRTWNTTTGRSLSTHPAPTGNGIFSPDGARVVSESRHTIRVWSTDTCRIDRTFMVVCDDQYVSITGDGRVEHSPDLRTELVYVLLTEEGQQLTTTPPKPAGGGKETAGVFEASDVKRQEKNHE